jgi:hypothetical protein
MAFDPNRRQNFAGLDRDIDDYIAGPSRESFDTKFPVAHGPRYVIKYLPATRLKSFRRSAPAGGGSKRLFAADKPGYTWGDAVYVSPLQSPFSSMFYGCVGVVGTVDPQRVFDAADAKGRSYYQEWIRGQSKWYELLTTTIHEEVANRYLRNRFRTHFQIDCVFFHPDQVAPGYANRRQDIWFAITHEVGGRVASGLTSAVSNPEWCVVLCEEFAPATGKLAYGPLLGPEWRGRPLGQSRIQQMSPKLESQIIQAYQQIATGGKLVTVSI